MIDLQIMLRAYRLMCMAGAMTDTYENNRAVCHYVHSTSRGHEAIQLATAFQLTPSDFVSPYYRDESLLLGLGFTPYQLMLQLLAKEDDIFTGGREYYSHPNYKGTDRPTIIHQSSATGMQAIPTTGIAHGLQLKEKMGLPGHNNSSIVICSLGDASLTEGEVSEAFQVAVLKQLPIIYLVQDNNWGISVTAEEARTMNAFEFAAGFKGMNRVQVDGSDFEDSYNTMKEVCEWVRKEKKPYLVHAKVPLLGHHTSGVRKEFYRSKSDLEIHSQQDPFLKLYNKIYQSGVTENELIKIKEDARAEVIAAFAKAMAASEPDIKTVTEHVFIPTPVTEEKGNRSPSGKPKIMMVDAALYAIREIMQDYPEAILYGQDVGKKLGGVFRETATLCDRFGENRVFNTAIQEAYIVGSAIGMAAVGLKPIVEIQFADYVYPGFNQLVSEVSKSCYLSCGKFPVQLLLRIPTGAYGGGGPYHSSSIESIILTIKGIKVVYPSNATDMKGLMKAAFLDPNPVVVFEHKGLYWSKLPGTEDARAKEPSSDYIIPLGKADIVLHADNTFIQSGESCVVITYGMGVYWSKAAAKMIKGRVEIIDLRTLFPLDEELIFERVKMHGRCLVVTEEPQNNSFAEALAGRISKECFRFLDAPVEVLGALNLPAVPININLEKEMLPNADKLYQRLKKLLAY